MSQNIKLIEYDDYKNIRGGLPNGFTETTESETIPNLTYAWNDTLKALHVNDSSSSIKGSLDMSLGFLNIGDVIEISVEVMNISGIKAKIAIDNIETGHQNLFILQSSSQNEFEVLGGKYIVKTSGEHKTAFGLFTLDVGEYYIRNVKITFQPSVASQQYPINKTMFEMFKRELRGYNIAIPDLTSATNLGDGVYRLLNNYGITIDYNVYNGNYIVNGTVNVNTYVYFTDLPIIEAGETVSRSSYYISGTIDSPAFALNNNMRMVDSLKSDLFINYEDKKIENTITETDVYGRRLRFYIYNERVFDNFTFKYKFEKGSTATPYTVPGQIPQYKIVGEE